MDELRQRKKIIAQLIEARLEQEMTRWEELSLQIEE